MHRFRKLYNLEDMCSNFTRKGEAIPPDELLNHFRYGHKYCRFHKSALSFFEVLFGHSIIFTSRYHLVSFRKTRDNKYYKNLHVLTN